MPWIARLIDRIAKTDVRTRAQTLEPNVDSRANSHEAGPVNAQIRTSGKPFLDAAGFRSPWHNPCTANFTRDERHSCSSHTPSIKPMDDNGSVVMKRFIGVIFVISATLLGCGPQDTGPTAVESAKPERRTVQKPVAEERPPPTPTAIGKVVLGSPELLAGIPGDGPLSVEEITAWLNDPANHAPLDIELPMWLKPGAGQEKDLKENPLTLAKIELGRQLFFDTRISADNTVSCASCHEPDKGYTVDVPLAEGIGGQIGRRNPPTLLNRVMLSLGDDKQFWDGRSVSVEDALLHALSDPTEMAASADETVARLKDIEGYRLQFEKLYGDVTWTAIGDSIGSFIRCLVTEPSPYDYYEHWMVYADTDLEFLEEDPALALRYQHAKADAEAHPISESAKRGAYLFHGNKAWCSACHNGVNFTDELYHNIGIGLEAESPDLGRYRVTGKDEDWGAFKTPTLRGIAYTAPYMHDGSLSTLEETVEWYFQGGRENRNLDYRYRRIGDETFTEQDKQDLVEFMKALSGGLPRVETARLPE
jgi:cytochrome c peroxidase